jgi:hypothetical protein
LAGPLGAISLKLDPTAMPEPIEHNGKSHERPGQNPAAMLARIALGLLQLAAVDCVSRRFYGVRGCLVWMGAKRRCASKAGPKGHPVKALRPRDMPAVFLHDRNAISVMFHQCDLLAPASTSLVV